MDKRPLNKKQKAIQVSKKQRAIHSKKRKSKTYSYGRFIDEIERSSYLDLYKIELDLRKIKRK